MDDFEDEDALFESPHLINCNVPNPGHTFVSDSKDREELKYISQQISPQDQNVFQDVVTQIKLCRCIGEDDLKFLENFETDIEYDERPIRGWKTSQAKIMLPVACGVVATATSFYYFHGKYKLIFGLSSLAILGMTRPSLLNLWNIVAKYKREKSIRKFKTQLASVLEYCEQFCLQLSKVLQYLKEVDILRRGFTLTTAKSSADPTQFSVPLGCRDNKFEIRREVFTLVRGVVMVFREATKNAVKLIPLIPSLDCISSYAAFINLSEFGSLLCTASDTQKLAADTCDFSVAALKSISQLCQLQISEFLRRLALCFCPEYWSNTIEITAVENLLVVVEPVLKCVHECVARSTKTLERIYGVLRKSCELRSREERSERITSNKGDFMKSVAHSLTLHLQSLFERAYELEEFMDNLKDEDQQWQNISNCLDEIRRRLVTCQSCLDEGSSYIDKIRNPSKSCRKSVNGFDDVNPELQKPRNVIDICEVENEIVDQVFEAYVDSVEQHETGEYSTNYPVDEGKVKDLEATSRMFDELKSVLVAKAAEFRHREAKAQGIKEPIAEDHIEKNEIDNQESRSNLRGRYQNPEIGTEDDASSGNFFKDLARLAVKKSEQFIHDEDTFGSDVESE